eukprot:TRINITY_DN43704_c0_g1_i2.p1 TRINITY_DN43704_c0_g1~~TRINITY_DN43704_c0_g1_i2.p1  ORF type:complete len:232 (-),score=32.24 TRINITY_DN43704_c0_g1_i2:219-914(-)
MEAWMRIANQLVMTVFFPFLEVLLTCVAVLAELPWPTAGLLYRGDLLLSTPTRWQLLERLLSGVDAAHPRVVEIGVSVGTTSEYLLKRAPNSSLLGIDPFINEPTLYETARGVYAAQSPEPSQPGPPSAAKSRLVRMTSMEAALSEELWTEGWNEIDLIFVDGAHDYKSCATDILMWAPRLRARGCIAGHDFSPLYMGVVRAVLKLVPQGTMLQFGPEGTWWWCRSGSGGA